MKKALYIAALTLFVYAAPILASQPQATTAPSGSEKGNNVAPRDTGGASSSKSETSKKSAAKSNKSRADKKEKNPPATASATPIANSNNSITDGPQPKSVTTVPTTANDTSAAKGSTGAVSSTAANSAALSSLYRVGVGDVLDIRLLNTPTRTSTLYTILPGGLIEYPLAGDPLIVTGMTTDEIAERLRSLIKIYDKPQVSVNVREYQSHSVIVTGLVNDPGMKYLRREMVPLYVVITEAQPRTEAGRAIIMRQSSPNVTIDLADTNAMATLVQPGDVIKLAPVPPQFYFVGGAISDPGQKNFHTGLTLTQAILAAGGTTRFAGGDVKVSRQGADGRLVTTKYNLKKIDEGKIPDPVLQPGDRIEVSRGGW